MGLASLRVRDGDGSHVDDFLDLVHRVLIRFIFKIVYGYAHLWLPLSPFKNLDARRFKNHFVFWDLVHADFVYHGIVD